MKEKFTKKKWNCREVGSQFAVGPLSDYDDHSFGMMNVIAWVEKFDFFDEDTSKANANLIAAAPDMYAEIERDIAWLERMIITHGENHPMTVAFFDMKCNKVELLAKARGE